MMSFTTQNYPASFKFLRQEVKNKAIEIANLLLKAGFQENVTEVIALGNSKLWVCYFINEQGNGRKNSNIHLVPHPEGWALISEDASTIFFVMASKNEALIRARSFAKNEKLRLYIHSPVGNINDSESFVVNRPVSGPDHHLISEGNCWAIKRKGAEKPSFIFDNKREAFRKAKWLAKKVHSKLIVHNREGDIEQQLSFGI